MSELFDEKTEALRLDTELDAFMTWNDEHTGNDDLAAMVANFALALIEAGHPVTYRVAASYLRWVRVRTHLVHKDEFDSSCRCDHGWNAGLDGGVIPCERCNDPGFVSWAKPKDSNELPW